VCDLCDCHNFSPFLSFFSVKRQLSEKKLKICGKQNGDDSTI
jgi:hypothetical protein